MSKSGINRTINISQPSIFGRVGTGFGQGLAEQLPKEIERERLASGLRNLSAKKDLSPVEQFTEFLSIPGAAEKPQVVQTMGELLRNQGLKQGFKNQSSSKPNFSAQSNENRVLDEIKFANLAEQRKSPINQNENPQNQINVLPNQQGQPQIVPKNPLSPELQPAVRWSTERMGEEIGDLADKHPYMTYDQIKQQAIENEQRYLQQPEDARRQQDLLRETQERIRGKFDKLLETKLQKQGSQVFADVSGSMKNNLIRGMESDLSRNPNKSEDDVINSWTEKGLDLAKTKKLLEAKAGSNLFATPILFNKEAYRKELEQFSDIYKKAANSEEFYNSLQSLYGMSPMGAAYLAYPRTKEVSSYLNSIKIPNNRTGVPYIDPKKSYDNSRKIAADIGHLITPQDSLLAIARELQQKDPYFNKAAFFEQLGNDKEEIGLNARQQRELTDSSQLLPSWADVLILPIFRGL